ncbi:helix-turn-helix domain-containing protein [Labedaea rhizosphaerae]|uniref:helix-turn-helix domain-containing protein n=1 Tax=Labedaea rhizosphaerae TaxID=598644 RepID=UPI00105E42A5|nr:PucR family transcriptional regulator ligand-binding domain-containing protein [Labedaea rhizosphaerae]
MRLSALLAAEQLGLRVLVGEDQLDRQFERVFTATLRDPRRYLTGGELVLSGMEWWQTPEESEAFVAALADADVAALGAGTADQSSGPVPDHMVQACRRHQVPLIEVPVTVSFATISEQVVLWLAAERAERVPGAGRFLDRYRKLVAAVAEGGGVSTLLSAGAAELDAPCWVLGASGRVVAGAGPLSASVRGVLAERFLQADQLPKVVRVDDRPVTLLSATARASHRVVSWFLVVDGDHQDWDSVRRELAGELATLIGLERSRLDEQRRLDAVAASPVLRLAAGSTGDVTSQLPELDLAAGDPVCAVSASVQGGSPGLAAALLTELLAPFGRRATVAEVEGETFGVARISPSDGLGSSLVTDIRAAVSVLDVALGSARLAVGASRLVDAANLRSAVHEARHARKLAELSPGRTTVVAGDDVASHLLLLAAVPEDLRASFRSRVLGPVLEYDAAHRSELVRTLRVFLRNSGSWTQTAADLHVHVNTLRYRIGRVAELTGRDLSLFPDRVDLYLALDQD